MSFLYETHMHTSEVSKCATSTAGEQVCRYKQLGYTGVIITDHFVNGYSNCPPDAPWGLTMEYFKTGYEAAKEAGDKCGLDVFFGWEYTIKGSDFLTYGLDIDFLLAYDDLGFLTIDEYSRRVRDWGGFIAQAHPYREAWYIESCLPADSSYIDAVEVYNSMDNEVSNKKARKFAEKNNLPMQAGSDCHNTLHTRYSGIVLHKKANDIFDIIDAIKNKEVELIYGYNER